MRSIGHHPNQSAHRERQPRNPARGVVKHPVLEPGYRVAIDGQGKPISNRQAGTCEHVNGTLLKFRSKSSMRSLRADFQKSRSIARAGRQNHSQEVKTFTLQLAFVNRKSTITESCRPQKRRSALAVLFVPQCHRWVDLHRASRWDVARRQCDTCQ
jgi:hypothetical protein